VLPLGRKFPFLRKFQPSEGNQKEIEFRRKNKEVRVNIRNIKEIRKFATKRRKI